MKFDWSKLRPRKPNFKPRRSTVALVLVFLLAVNFYQPQDDPARTTTPARTSPTTTVPERSRETTTTTRAPENEREGTTTTTSAPGGNNAPTTSTTTPGVTTSSTTSTSTPATTTTTTSPPQ